jgi:hypothetical protein
MAAIRKNDKGRFSATMISDSEIQEHSDMVESAESHLADFKKILIGSLDKATIPEVKSAK